LFIAAVMKRSPSLAPRLLPMLVLAAACLPLEAAQAQQYKLFKDWVVGCDNRRTCTVLGLPAQDAGDQAAFIRLVREGGAEALPAIELVYASENPMEGTALELAIDGQPVAGLVAGPIAAKGDGYTVRAALGPAEAMNFIVALRNAKSATLHLLERGKSAGEVRTVSLAGSAAALLFVDAQQKRDGGVTALVGRGKAPASAVPPLPELPVVASLSIEELDQPLPPLPSGVPTVKPASCPAEQPLALRLGGGATLWGVCDSAGAYNFGFRMYLARQGAAQLQRFDLPGEKPDSVLVNPGVMEDRRTLNSFNKGRGPGDCGDSADWVWNGTTFKLLRYSTLKECRGVPSDDWPQVYIARRQ